MFLGLYDCIITDVPSITSTMVNVFFSLNHTSSSTIATVESIVTVYTAKSESILSVLPDRILLGFFSKPNCLYSWVIAVSFCSKRRFE